MNWCDLTEEERYLQCGRWIAADGRIERFGDLGLIPLDPIAAAARLGAELVDPGSPEFPASVRDRIAAGPWFVRGQLPAAGPRVAIVGSRQVSHEGVRLCRSIASGVAAAGVVVVSGGAIGVDTLAHEAALSVGGQTVAILPSSFDCPTPARNRTLFERIAESGALVSEYPPGVGAHRFHFIRRNELIAAYADAVLIIRAKAKSGTMITARAAQRLGRPLWVVPGSPEDKTAEGCNALLREGARCVTNAAEVLAELELAAPHQPRPTPPTAVSANAQATLELIESGVDDVDELGCRTGLRAHEVLVALTELEMVGRIVMRDGAWQATRRHARG